MQVSTDNSEDLFSFIGDVIYVLIPFQIFGYGNTKIGVLVCFLKYGIA